MKIHAIIPAAGRGLRFSQSGLTKQFQPLGGIPLFIHSLRSFESCPLVDSIILVIPEQDMGQAKEVVKNYDLKKLSKIVPGGTERQDSVRKGLKAASPCDFVVVHDGVRPLVTPALIEKTILTARKSGACITGLPVKETLKRVTPDLLIQETVDRRNLWSIQTPQAFRYEILEKALKKAEEDGFVGTDESMLVERIGIKVQIIEGSPFNLKITTPQDLKLAEFLLQSGRSS